jgi:cytochrome c peroxidase
MTSKSLLKLSPILLAAGLFIGMPLVGTTQSLTPIEELGKLLFFDQKLSIRNNQSCASCHAATSGWTGPIPGINLKGAVYFGSIRTEFGNRKPPSSAYASTSPIFDYDPAEDLFFGGNFWDGRATGWDLGNPAADQARGPFLNPVEQALPNKAAVVKKVCSSKYAGLFRQVWGNEICKDVNAAYDKIALSIEAYEDSIEVNQFSSKYDWVKAGKAKFTPQEQWGFDLFETKGKCALCHVVDFSNKTKKDLFTDYTFDNLGIPKNPLNPFYQTDPDFVDYGLGDFLRSLAEDGSWRSAPYLSSSVAAMTDENLIELADANDGKHKVPTLRNVDKRPGPGYTKAYGHNGYFKSLKGIVNFYNTRDVKPVCPGPYTEKEAQAAGCWPTPEVAANVNTDELGNLGLSDEEEDAIVAFMATISDGYKPKRK